MTIDIAIQRKQLQTQLTELATAEKFERRKADLPYTKPSQAKLSYIGKQQTAIKEGLADISKYEADNQQLATGEWIAKTEYTKLDADAKNYLNEHGIEKYNRDYATELKTRAKVEHEPTPIQLPTIDKFDRKEWEAKHFELDTKEWIDKAAYNKLDQNAKDYINKYGIAWFNDYYIPAQKWLGEATEAKFYADNMQLNTGDWISKADYLSLDMDSQNYIQLHGVEKFTLHVDSINKVLDTLKPYTDKEGGIDAIDALRAKVVTPAQLKLVGVGDTAIKQAKHYAGIGKVRTFWEGITPWEEWQGERATVKGVGEIAAVMLVPGVWAKDWKDMSTKWRAVNIAIDVAFLIPFVGWIAKGAKVGAIGLHGLRISTKAIKVTNQAAKAANIAHVKLTKATKALHGARMGTARYSKLASDVQHLAQASMKADKAFANSLSELTRVTPRQLAKFEKVSKMPGIKKSVIDVGKAQTELSKAWNVLDRYKVGTKPYIQQLAKVQKAQTRLDTTLGGFDKTMRPRVKVGKSAGWDKIMSSTEKELQRAEAELERLLAKQKQGLHINLDYLKTVRDTVKSLKAELSNFRADITAGKSPPLAEGYRMGWAEIPKTEPDKLISDIEGFLRQRGGTPEPGIQQPLPFKGGGVAAPTKVAVRVAPKVQRVMPGVSKLRLKPVYKPTAKAPVAKPKVPSAFPGVTPKPKVYRPPTREAAEIMAYEAIILPATRGLTKAAQKAAVQAATRAAIRNAVRAATQGATQAQIKGQVEAALKPLTKIMPQAKVKTIVKTIVKVTPKITTKLATKIPIPKPKVRPKPKIRIIIPLPKGKSRQLTEKEAAGIIAWRQGFIYKLLYTPYGEKQIANTRKPIEGVVYHRGAGSAMKSIIAKGGVVPRVVTRDMGVVDIRIATPKGSRKPRITFKRDRYQRTKTTPKITTMRR